MSQKPYNVGTYWGHCLGDVSVQSDGMPVTVMCRKLILDGTLVKGVAVERHGVSLI